MGNKKTLIILVLVLVMLIGGASVLYTQMGKYVEADQLSGQGNQQQNESPEAEGEGKENEPPAEKIMAPDFGVYDEDGNKVFLSDFVGKPTVVNFWASWCGPCKREMPDFHEKYLELGDEINFLMVNMTDGFRETVEGAYQFISEEGYAFPVFYDTDMDAAAAYGVYSLPTTYFIDSDGYVITRVTGAIDGDTLLRGIDMIIE